jgi:hydrogenase maturation factor
MKRSFYPAGKLPPKDLARLLARHARRHPSLAVPAGIGADAAVISLSAPFLAAKTDAVTFAADRIGHYAVHVNANDVACMGAIPRWFLAAVLLPEGRAGPSEAEEIFSQISKACRELGVALAGGHTEITHGLDRPIVVGHMLGEARGGRWASPDQIRPGDDILLTQGIAIEGTALIARERPGRLGKALEIRCRRMLDDPGISVVRAARIAFGAAEVHAMHDPTEGGLSGGLRELAQASRLGMLVEMDRIRVFPETRSLCGALGLDPLGLLASGALLVAAPPGQAGKVLSALRAEGIPAEVIAKAKEKGFGVKLRREGRASDLPAFARDEVARLFDSLRA